MISIKLPKNEWKYDPTSPLGQPGGFGAVFGGFDKDQNPIAVKRLHLSASSAAHRELEIAEVLINQKLAHVMPIYDAGQDSESDFYYVVMPKAQKSLQDEISQGILFDTSDTVKILLEIAKGLKEVDSIVHRDLKPGNILYHDDTWKIADFGIARFVEETTSLRTLKECLSPQYAAPEQWQLKRATGATDIYALGCIAYTLLSGKPPFSGMPIEDLREAHLFQQPPLIVENEPRLRALITMMLRKNPSGRPSLERVIKILEEIDNDLDNPTMDEGLQDLAKAGALAADDENRSDAYESELEYKKSERTLIANEAFKILQDVMDQLNELITRIAPNAISQRKEENRLNIKLGNASLEIFPLRSGQPIAEKDFSKSKWSVIAGACIIITQNKPTVYKWGANLWYTDLGLGAEFRWWEVSYYNFGNSRIQKYFNYTPFALGDSEKDFQDADLAASKTMHVINIATKPTQVDDENVSEFCNRWSKCLASAFKGELSYPRELPIS